jgi:hypothetical protein
MCRLSLDGCGSLKPMLGFGHGYRIAGIAKNASKNSKKNQLIFNSLKIMMLIMIWIREKYGFFMNGCEFSHSRDKKF